MSVTDVDLSRAISHALRHDPSLYLIELDEAGWIPVDTLFTALGDHFGGDWTKLSEADVRRMLASSEKQRHEIRDGSIRARYGHSTPVISGLDWTAPPPNLYHGTSPDAWLAIKTGGLSPMRRQFVHLSSDVVVARSVGSRKAPRPVILRVDAAAASAEGIRFASANDAVWITPGVPPEFIEELDSRMGQGEDEVVSK